MSHEFQAIGSTPALPQASGESLEVINNVINIFVEILISKPKPSVLAEIHAGHFFGLFQY